MNSEQLKDLLEKVTQGDWETSEDCLGYWISVEGDRVACAEASHDEAPINAKLIALAPSLARRVLAADKLVEALTRIAYDTPDRLQSNVFAYEREARASLAEYEASK